MISPSRELTQGVGLVSDAQNCEALWLMQKGLCSAERQRVGVSTRLMGLWPADGWDGRVM
jgi:hypothetical protein